MADEEEHHETELSDNQKIDIAKWFLLNSPPGEIQYVAKDLRSVLSDENVYRMAASEAFPFYNKTHIISLQFPDRSGDVLVSSFSEISEDEYLDPRTAQIAKVDHVKQICTDIRPAKDEELPTPYIEEYRCALDAEVCKYVAEAYPKGVCSVYCTRGKDVDEPGFDFQLVVLITATRLSPQNFWYQFLFIFFFIPISISISIFVTLVMEAGAQYGTSSSWTSYKLWKYEEKCKWVLTILKKGMSSLKRNMNARIQLCFRFLTLDSFQIISLFLADLTPKIQSPDDSSFSLANIIRHHETEYMTSLETSYSNLPDSTFKDLRRKLPVTRTLFPWHNTMQFSLTRDITKELGIEK
ncbi:hypothetical protein LXL04_028757 [Taraxacum kok-saghyz]